MKRWWRVVYEVDGVRGVGFREAITKAGVRQLLSSRYPGMRIIRISEAKP